MTASELIANKQIYDELEAHFREKTLKEVADALALPDDIPLECAGEESGYIVRQREVVDVLRAMSGL